MKIYFSTRSKARTFANKTGRKSPTTKEQSVNKWAVDLTKLKSGLRFGLNSEIVEDWDNLLD